MSSPDKSKNPFYPQPTSSGEVRYSSVLQLRQSLNWAAKNETGLSAAQLWKRIKAGEYDNMPLKDEFEGAIWLLEGASMPSYRQQLLNPDLVR
jgi:hypothetical protein